ncbi:deoxyribodipyrimidine photo-lyase [Brevibacillus centrosporus]|nr:deoxyribodipyrimidine photo-lyase [Brevibacillus centrosporus]MED4911409.1 deoxyribodipyrimidine photo-lyase [Brevibacillus centrosporus]
MTAIVWFRRDLRLHPFKRSICSGVQRSGVA